MFQLGENISLSYYAAVNSDISKLFVIWDTEVLYCTKGYTFSKERERDCVGERTMFWPDCCALFRGILASLTFSQQMLNL